MCFRSRAGMMSSKFRRNDELYSNLNPEAIQDALVTTAVPTTFQSFFIDTFLPFQSQQYLWSGIGLSCIFGIQSLINSILIAHELWVTDFPDFPSCPAFRIVGPCHLSQFPASGYPQSPHISPKTCKIDWKNAPCTFSPSLSNTCWDHSRLSR